MGTREIGRIPDWRNPKEMWVITVAEDGEPVSFLSRFRNFQTGVHYTLAEMMRDGHPPEQEKEIFSAHISLLKGTVDAGLKVRKNVKTVKGPRTVVSTESKDSRIRAFLREKVAAFGTIHESESTRELRIDLVLSDSDVQFLTTPVDENFLGEKEQYVPYLQGLFGIGLSEKQHRLSHKDGGFLGMIHRIFPSHFGFSLGKLESERNTHVLSVADQAFATLQQEMSVALPSGRP